MQPEHIIYPSGNLGSGRTELSQYLSERYGFEVINWGVRLRSLYENREEEHSDLSLGQFILKIEDNDSNFFSGKLATRIEEAESPEGRVVIEDIRASTDIIGLTKLYPEARHTIIWIQAGFQLIKSRYNKKEGKELSDYEFSTLTVSDQAKGIASLKEKANYRIENNGSIDAFQTNADAIMLSLGILALG